MSGVQEAIRDVPIAELDRRFEALRLPGTPAKRAALRAALEADGQQQPVLVSDGLEAGQALVLVDGFKRSALLEAAGHEEILARVASLDSVAALLALLASNGGRRGPADLEEGWVVQTLRDEHGLTQTEIASRLRRHKTWVCRRLKLVTQLERQVQDDVRLGLLSGTVARELARLPRGNQAAAAKAVAQHGLSSRQTARLVDALARVRSTRQQQAILTAPLEHVRASEQLEGASADPRLSEVANRVRQQLLRLHGAANRLTELFLDHPPGSFSGQDAAALAELAGPIAAGASEALEHVRRLPEVAGAPVHA